MEELTREALINSGHINVRKHPTEPLQIFNYSQRTQFDRVWNDHTRECRGLICHENGEVIARSYVKFFSHGDPEAVPLPSSFRVADKLDGSLGILYREPTSGLLSIATRGSFESNQAKHATEVLRGKYADFSPPTGTTFLFEIVFPENRIVLDYGDLDDLILHGVLHTKTGADLPDLMKLWPGPKAGIYDFTSIEQIPLERVNTEGYVLVEWPPPKDRPAARLKMKLKDYERLHKLLSGLTPHRVWECLAAGDPLLTILDGVPDEMFNEAQKVANDYLEQHKTTKNFVEVNLRKIQDEANRDREQTVPHIWSRKDFAMRIQQEPESNRKFLFLLLDGKSIDAAIWRSMEPRGDLRMSSTPDLDG